MGLSLYHHHRLLVSILAVFVVGVKLHTLLKSFHRLVILLEELMGSALASPRLHKLWVQFDSFLSILQGLCWSHEFDISEGSVAVDEFVIWITFCTFVKLSECAREVTGLEELISCVFVLIGEFGVDVGQSIPSLLLLLYPLHGFLDVVVIELKEGLTVGRK